jgi:uncharacterized membrane protein
VQFKSLLFRKDKEMATKKAAAKQDDGGSNGWAKWVYLGGVIVAGLVAAFGFTAADPYLQWVLVLAGVLAGIFFLDSGDVVNFGVRFLLLSAVAGALGAVPAVGSYLSGFFGGVVGFLGPVALTLLVVYFWKKYFGSMM